MIDTLDLGGGRVQNHWKDQVEYILGLICTQGCLLVEYKFQFLKEEASSVTCTIYKSKISKNMRQDCCGILPTFLSFGTHQGRTTPYVTVNPKPLWAFSSLPPQRNVSFPQQITIITIHHFCYHKRPVEEHLLEKQHL